MILSNTALDAEFRNIFSYGTLVISPRTLNRRGHPFDLFAALMRSVAQGRLVSQRNGQVGEHALLAAGIKIAA